MTSKIQALQLEIYHKQKELIALRLDAELEEIQDYVFWDKLGKKRTLSELFKHHDELLVIHNMGQKCKYCTMWADGFRGYNEMILDRMPWVLTSPDHYQDMDNFAKKRDWNFLYLSFHETSFAKDLGFEYEKDGKKQYQPGVSALIKKGNKIFRASKDAFGPGDLYNPVWHFYNLFPKGADGWHPKFEY